MMELTTEQEFQLAAIALEVKALPAAAVKAMVVKVTKEQMLQDNAVAEQLKRSLNGCI